MLQRDYISKVIEEMSNLTARIMGFRLEGKLEQALEYESHFYKSYVPVGPEALLSLSPEEIQNHHVPELKKMQELSSFLVESAELERLQGNTADAVRKYEQALRLLAFVDEQDRRTFSQERRNTLGRIRKCLADLSKNKI